MSHPSFYRIKISKVQAAQRSIPFITPLVIKEDEVFYSVVLGDEVDEAETIVKMRSTGDFTNRPQVTKYRFSFVKVSYENADHLLVLCTRFYTSMADVISALKGVLQMPEMHV